MDGCVVHEENHWSFVISTIISNLEEQLVDEVLEHRGIDTSFDQLNGHDLLLSDRC